MISARSSSVSSSVRSRSAATCSSTLRGKIRPMTAATWASCLAEGPRRSICDTIRCSSVGVSSPWRVAVGAQVSPRFSAAPSANPVRSSSRYSGFPSAAVTMSAREEASTSALRGSCSRSVRACSSVSGPSASSTARCANSAWILTRKAHPGDPGLGRITPTRSSGMWSVSSRSVSKSAQVDVSAK